MEEDAVLTNPARYNEVTQEMARRWKLSTAVAGLVATAWVAAAILPIDILAMDHSESLGCKLQVIGAPGAVIGNRVVPTRLHGYSSRAQRLFGIAGPPKRTAAGLLPESGSHDCPSVDVDPLCVGDTLTHHV